MNKLSNEMIMTIIMDNIGNLKVSGRFNKRYLPKKAVFTNAMTESIIDTCKKLGLKYKKEAEFRFSKHFREKYNRKWGLVDIVIYNPSGKNIALEIDSTNTNKVSYGKLCELSSDEENYDAYWIIWNRNKSGKPFQTSYKDDYTRKNESFGYTNKRVKIIRHTFHPTIFQPLT